MSSSGDATEQVICLTLEGVEVAAKITGSAAKNIAALILAALKSNDNGDKMKLRGKERLTTMLKSGQPLEIFSVKERDLKAFAAGAKQYGIVYCVLKGKIADKDGVCDVLVKASDAPKINRLVERLKLADVERTRSEGESGECEDTADIRNEPETSEEAAEPTETEEINDIEWLLDELLGTEEKETERSETGEKPEKPLTDGEQAIADWEGVKTEAETAVQNLESVKIELKDAEKAVERAEDWAYLTNEAMLKANNALDEAENTLKSAEEDEHQKMDKMLETSDASTELKGKADESGLKEDIDRVMEAEKAAESALSEYNEAKSKTAAARSGVEQARETADTANIEANNALEALADAQERLVSAQENFANVQTKAEETAKTAVEAKEAAFKANKISYNLTLGSAVYVDENKYVVQKTDRERVLLQDANEPLKTWSLYREDLEMKLFDDRNNDELIIKDRQTKEGEKDAEREDESTVPLSEKAEESEGTPKFPPSEPLSTKKVEHDAPTTGKETYSRKMLVKDEIADITERRKKTAEIKTPADSRKTLKTRRKTPDSIKSKKVIKKKER